MDGPEDVPPALGPDEPATHGFSDYAEREASLRMDLPAAMAGFSPPPCHVHLKFVDIGDGTGRDGTGLLALTEAGKTGAIASWLETYGPTEVRIAPGLAPKFLEADFRELPKAWRELLSPLHVRHLELSPDGTASVFIQGPIPEIGRFIEAVQSGQPVVRFRKTKPAAEPVKLTRRQLEALSRAVALGYFEIPHKVDLRTLGKGMGLTHGAVSELLRRAEGLILTSYIDSLAEARWEGSADAAKQEEPEEPGDGVPEPPPLDAGPDIESGPGAGTASDRAPDDDSEPGT